MSDLSIRSFSGAAPPTVARPAPPEPPAVQQAVAQPLTGPQSAITQAPDAANAQWRNQRNGNANVQLQQESTAGQQQSASTATSERLTDTVNYLNQFLQRFDTSLQFDVNNQYGEMVVRIVDRQTKDVIRQIPSEETLAFARFFKEMDEHGQSLPKSSQSSAMPDGQRLKVEGLLLNTKI
ncbi:MAG TPA: flagellar protein FlaG [Candidatus Competibacter sp.]|nr:flagellar protein FlaG [Candidatus Competibacter sp.]